MNYLSEREEAFDNIYRVYADDVYKFCLYLAKDYYVAQDLAQQTFINFYNRLGYETPENILAYLLRIARNLYYNYQRDARRGISVESMSEYKDDIRLSAVDPETEYLEKSRKAMEKELSDKILEYLRKEHKNWYEIFDKMYFAEKSHDEISSELGITEEVLYSRIYRAKKCIRKRYKKKFEDIMDLA